MKEDRYITGFYIETVILILVFVGVIMILANIFGIAKRGSTEANRLTVAVNLASNAAEGFSAAKDTAELAGILDENGNAVVTGDAVTAYYNDDGRADLQGPYEVIISWEPEGDLVRSHITVSYGHLLKDTEEIYSIDTASYKAAGEG